MGFGRSVEGLENKSKHLATQRYGVPGHRHYFYIEYRLIPGM